ncbi:MAG TPA: hypothetical protein DGX96_01110 [Lachnospiraceae bacterium]|jgi:hypothetical protein|nr:hypothetical protein [Lachnospiraceae bacterium]
MFTIVQPNQYFDTKLDFCKVTGRKTMRALEREFMMSGISYYLKTREPSLIERMLYGRNRRLRPATIFCINAGSYDRAYEIASQMPRVKVIARRPADDFCPMDLARSKQKARQEQMANLYYDEDDDIAL